MSFDIFLQPFRNGEAGVGDGTAAVEVLVPVIAERGDSWARIVTADGGADVYGMGDPATGLMVNHAAGGRVFDLLYELARHAGFAVIPVGCPTCIPDPAMSVHLPPELAVDAIVIESGADLRRAIENS